jgi:hypothetical protein
VQWWRLSKFFNTTNSFDNWIVGSLTLIPPMNFLVINYYSDEHSKIESGYSMTGTSLILRYDVLRKTPAFSGRKRKYTNKKQNRLMYKTNTLTPISKKPYGYSFTQRHDNCLYYSIKDFFLHHTQQCTMRLHKILTHTLTLPSVFAYAYTEFSGIFCLVSPFHL